MNNENVGSIEYDARILTKNLKSDAAKADDIARQTGDNVGSNMEKGSGRARAALGAMLKFAKYAVVGTAAALSAAIGKFVIGGGISRALNIEDAQAKLKGLGHDVKSVQAIMDSALKSVKGTAFGLDAAATAAASAVAAGVKPGKELTRVLSLTGDAATIMGRDFGDAGAIINKVLASNRVSMEEVNQLSDAGLPILSMLGKEYGKTAAQMREMVSDGEVDSKRFLKALQTNIGGAALASGETTRGAWNNMKAAMSRVGAAIVKDIIPRVRDSFGSMTKWFDSNSDNIVNSVGKAVDTLKSLGKSVVAIGRDVGSYLSPKLRALANTLSGSVLPVMRDLWRKVIVPLAPAFGSLLVGAVGATIDVLNALLHVLSPIASFLITNRGLVLSLAAGFGTFAVALKIWDTVDRLRVALNVLRLVTLPGLLASVGSFAALLTGPLGIAITVVSILAAALAAKFFSQKLETDRVKEASDRLKASYEALKNAQDRLKNSQLGLEGATLAVERAQRAYTEAVRQYGPKSLEAREAAHNLKRAQNELKNAHVEVKNAVKAQNSEETKLARNHQLITSADAKTRAMQRLHDTLGLQPGAPYKQFKPSGRNSGDPLGILGRNAKGTDNWRGGATWVGEQGPEIINLPKGSQVIPNHEISTSGPAQNINITLNLSGIMASSKADERSIGKRLIRVVNDELTAKGIPALGGGAI